MKKKILSFFCVLAALMIGQSAWAAAGDMTTTTTYWSNGELNYVQSGAFVRTAPSGFVTFKLSGDLQWEYTTQYLAAWGSKEARLQSTDRLHVNEKKNFTLTWSIPEGQKGYTFVPTGVRTIVACTGVGSYFALGDEKEIYLANAAGSKYSTETSNMADYQNGMKMYYRRGDGTRGYCMMTGFDVKYQIIPDAPTWTKAADNMNVTVDDVLGQKFYDLSSNINVTNPAFAGTVKYEITSNNAEYAIWNGEHTAFYVLKPGTYTVKAYIEKVDGQYCSSAYSTEFTITAATADADKANAQIYFYFDEQKVEPFDRPNHIYKVELPLSSAEEHWVEYVTALTPEDVNIVGQTTYGLTYLEKTEKLKDHFMLTHKSASDTILIEQNGVYYRLVIVSTTMGSNHLPYTITETDQFTNSTIVTYTDKITWNDAYNDIEFNEVGAFETAKTRTINFTYTGIPDSVKFTYNTLADLNRDNVRLKLSYAVDPGQWVEVAQVSAPASSSSDKVCAYAIPANAKYVQLQYYNAQYKGWVRDFTITERKGFTMNIPAFNPTDTEPGLVIKGRHQKGGLASVNTYLNWYNLEPSFNDTITQMDEKQFAATVSGIDPLELDKFQENVLVKMDLKLDSVGVFNTYYMVWRGDVTEPQEKKYTYGIWMRGIVGYNEGDVVIENTLPSDTIPGEQGTPIDNPFVVKDTAGNVITDSLEYQYEFLPEGSAHVDENGKIVPDCVGYIRVAASLKENEMIPGGLKDTVVLYVPETSPNVIKWNKPNVINKGDILPAALASTEDGAAMTFEFIPATMVEEVTDGYQVMQAGAFQIVAKAAQTCDHFAINDTVDVYANGLVASIELNSTVDPANLNVLDTIANMFVVKGESGDTLDAPEASIAYSIEPAKMYLDEDGNFVVAHSGDVKVTVTVTGDTLKPASQDFYFTLNPIAEQIFCNIPETLMIDKTYDLKNELTSTLSKLGITSVRVPETYENMLSINGCVITTLKKGVVRIIMTANGNDDFIGPVEYMKEITIVGAVKDITWEDQLKEDLENAQVGDTIPTSKVKVFDEDGNEITGTEKTYEIIPEGAAHVTPEGDIVVDLPIDPITVVVTTEKEGMETKVDTIVIQGKPASISEIELPAELVEGKAQKGDVIPMDGVKVYDQNGKDITDQIDEIIYVIEPSDAAHIDENGNLVIDKAEDFTITTKVTDPLVDPAQSTYTTPVTVAPFVAEQIVQPIIPGNVLPGDQVDMNGTKVYDNEGNDITDKCNITYVFEPEGGAVYDEQTGVITFTNAGAVKVVTVVTGKEGEGVQGKTFEEIVSVGKLTPAPEYNLPEPSDGFHGGDVIPVDIVDVNGNPMKDYADIEVKIEPEGKATYDPETGEITIDEKYEGPLDVTITVGGDNVQPAVTYTETIYVHNDETGCYDFLVQLWNDAAMVDNDAEYSPAKFVRFEWYKDGVKVEGQNGQFYYEAKGAAMKGVYRAVAYDAAGNAYKICEQEFNGAAVADIVKPYPVVIPTVMSTSDNYTIETAMEGQVIITNTNGAIMERYHVTSGVNTKHAPAANGVFVLHYTAKDGHSQACKLIVK